MKLATLSIFAIVAFADNPKPKPIDEIKALRLEVASLRLDLMAKELEAIHARRNAIIKDICAAAEVPIERCIIDPQTRTVSAKEAK